MRRTQAPSQLIDLESNLGNLLGDGLYTLTIRRYSSRRPATSPPPLPVLRVMLDSVRTLKDAQRSPEDQRAAFEAMACYLPYPEERLNYLDALQVTPELDTSVSQEQVRTALDVVVPWLCWEPATVEAIHKVMQDYLQDCVGLSFGVYGLEADPAHTGRIRDHRRHLRELLGDDGGAGRLEALLRVINAPKLVRT